MPWAGGSGSAAPVLRVAEGRAGHRQGSGCGSGRPPLPGCLSPACPAEPPVPELRVGEGAWRTGKGRARPGSTGLLSPRLLAQVLGQAGRDLDHKANLGLKIKLDFFFFFP